MLLFSVALMLVMASMANPVFSNYSLTARKGWLRLAPSIETLESPASPTFVARRQTETNFSSTTLLDGSEMTDGIQAGLTAYAAPLNHYDVVAEKRDGRLFVKAQIRIGEMSHIEKETEMNGPLAYLRITSDKAYYYLQVSSDNQLFTTLTRMDYRYLSTEVIGGFTGVMLGLFCTAPQTKGFAYFDWFEYSTKENIPVFIRN